MCLAGGDAGRAGAPTWGPLPGSRTRRRAPLDEGADGARRPCSGAEVCTDTQGPQVSRASFTRCEQPRQASRTLAGGGRLLLRLTRLGSRPCTRFSQAPCVFEELSRSLLDLCSARKPRPRSQNCPRIFSSVQRKNVLFQTQNVSLYSHAIVTSWKKHAAPGGGGA